MRCSATDCRNNEDGYCSCENYIEITEDGNCDSYEVPSYLPRCMTGRIPSVESTEYVAVREDNEIETFICKGVGNPCGCGSNCFHYRRKDGVIHGYCNACGSAIYEIKPEYYEEFLKNHKWKKVIK